MKFIAAFLILGNNISMDNKLHRIALTVIIHKDGTYLITKRSMREKAFPGKWTVPGGNLETDDYIHQPPTTPAGQWYYALENGIRREVKEEVGLEIGKATYLLDIAYIRPDGVPSLILSYYAPYVSGEVEHDEDTVDSAWVTAEEAKGYDLIDGIAEEIEMVDKILKGK
jgi:8-oxo-dGTP pyrophosphatase MutT (NUDIX family)